MHYLVDSLGLVAAMFVAWLATWLLRRIKQIKASSPYLDLARIHLITSSLQGFV